MEGHYGAYEEKAKKILDNCTYMAVGTSTKRGIPWVAPVLFVYDNDFNIYFLSAVDALHSKNILENADVAVSIFDSRQEIGVSEGIQARGKASLVEKDDIENAITLYCKKVFPESDMEPTKRYVPENHLGTAEFRFFRIKLTAAYVTGEDRRVEVGLRGK